MFGFACFCLRTTTKSVLVVEIEKSVARNMLAIKYVERKDGCVLF